MYSPYATTRLADRLTPHWQCTNTLLSCRTRLSMSSHNLSKSSTTLVLWSQGTWMYSGSGLDALGVPGIVIGGSSICASSAEAKDFSETAVCGSETLSRPARQALSALEAACISAPSFRDSASFSTVARNGFNTSRATFRMTSNSRASMWLGSR